MTLWYIKTSSVCHPSSFKSWSRESLLSSRGKGPGMRDPVNLRVKLAVTLRHLASGDRYTTLVHTFRVASSTINMFVPEVCDAIIRAYRDLVMWCPTLSEDWSQVESVFHQRWNIPGCPGWKGYSNQSTGSSGWRWGLPGQRQMLKF